jgi:hypothetical protein
MYRVFIATKSEEEDLYLSFFVLEGFPNFLFKLNSDPLHYVYSWVRESSGRLRNRKGGLIVQFLTTVTAYALELKL